MFRQSSLVPSGSDVVTYDFAVLVLPCIFKGHCLFDGFKSCLFDASRLCNNYFEHANPV